MFQWEQDIVIPKPLIIVTSFNSIKFDSLYSAKHKDIYTKLPKEIIFIAWSPEENPNRRACKFEDKRMMVMLCNCSIYQRNIIIDITITPRNRHIKKIEIPLLENITIIIGWMLVCQRILSAVLTFWNKIHLLLNVCYSYYKRNIFCIVDILIEPVLCSHNVIAYVRILLARDKNKWGK